MLEQLINQLEQAVKDFDYSQLRVVPVKQGDKIFHRASLKAMRKLFEMFPKALANQTHGLANWEKSQQETILKIANILLQFKHSIQAMENEYFQDQEYGSHKAYLKDNTSWLTYFYFVIGQYLDTINDDSLSPTRYGQTLKTIQNLSESTFKWIAEHQPGLKEKYTELKSKNYVETHEEKAWESLKPKSLFSLFDDIADTSDNESSDLKQISLNQQNVEENDTELQLPVKRTHEALMPRGLKPLSGLFDENTSHKKRKILADDTPSNVKDTTRSKSP